MKKSIVLFAVLILILSLCACNTTQSKGQSAQISQDRTWQEQYDLGIRYLSEGNYEEAILAFTAAIEIDPKQADAYISLADAYWATSDVERAIQVLSNAMEAVEDIERIQEKLDELALRATPKPSPEPTPEPTSEPTPEPTLEATLGPTPEPVPEIGALAAYRAFLEKGAQTISTGSNSITIISDGFQLVELDGDGEPELIVASRSTEYTYTDGHFPVEGFWVCDFQAGSVIPVYWKEWVDSIYPEIYYILGTSALGVYEHGTSGYLHIQYIFYSGGSTWYDNYYREENLERAMHMDATSDWELVCDYYHEDEPISRETFHIHDFSNVGGTEIHFFDNTEANREAFLK